MDKIVEAPNPKTSEVEVGTLASGDQLFNFCLHAKHARYIHAEKRFDMMSLQAPQGAGKSSCGIKIEYDFFNGDWNKVAEHLAFELKPLIPKLQACINNDRIWPMEVFDDATLPFSKYMQFQKGGFSHIDKINKFITLSRTTCSFLIIISVTDDVLSEIRKKSWLRGTVSDISHFCGILLKKNERVVQSYRVRISPDGKEWYKRMYADIYPLFYDYAPEWFLKWYKEERKKATQDILNQLAESLMDQGGFAPTAEDIAAHESWTECGRSFTKGVCSLAGKGFYLDDNSYRRSVLQVEAWMVRNQKLAGVARPPPVDAIPTERLLDGVGNGDTDT